MTNNEIRIAIAEACGYRVTDQTVKIEPEPWPDSSLGEPYKPSSEHKSYRFRLLKGNKLIESISWYNFGKPDFPIPTLQDVVQHLPDYPNDLNAMHEALVCLLRKRKLRAFCNVGSDGTWECIITENETPNGIPCDGDHYGAGNTLVKAMREAFLRTIGKWKD